MAQTGWKATVKTLEREQQLWNIYNWGGSGVRGKEEKQDDHITHTSNRVLNYLSIYHRRNSTGKAKN